MNKDKQAFVYLWMDSKNKMWYLGSHIGNNSNYAHSSSVMESFTINNTPPYMKRRILAYGTYEEMIELEVRLLGKIVDRDDYYNIIVSYPPPPTYGEDNHMWKGGIWTNDVKAYNQKYYSENKEKFHEYWKERSQRPGEKEREKEYMKEWRQRPEVIEREKEYNQRPEVKAKQREHMKESRQRPEVIEREKEYGKEYRQRPEVIKRSKEYMKEWRQRPEVIEKEKAYRQRPEVKARQKESYKKWYKKKRALNICEI